MEQHEIETLATRLGAGAETQIDVDRVAETVLGRLRTETVPVRWWRRSSVLKIAAAVAVLAVGGYVLTGGNPERMDTTIAAAPLALDDLSPGALGEVLDSLAQDAPVYELVGVGLEDLDEAQLQALLASMEL